MNRKLSAKQGRWSWRLRAPWARWAAHGVNGPGSGVSTHFPMGFNFQSNVILGERGVQITQGTLLLAGDYMRGDVSMALASDRLQEGAVVSKHRGRRGGE